MTKRVIAWTMMGATIFVGINAGATYELQRSLIVARNLGAYAHWALVLLALPLISGSVIRVMRLPYRTYIIPVCSVIAAALLFPAYRNKFWAEPPHPLAAVMYAGIVAGVAFIPNQRLLSLIRGLFHHDRQPDEIDKPIDRTGESQKPLPREVEDRQSSFLGASLPGFLESPTYAGLLATIQLMLSFLSLVLSAVSILLLGSK